MKIILVILLSQISLTVPSFSHGSSEDCSSKCNDYYCPPEMKKEQEKKSLENN